MVQHGLPRPYFLYRDNVTNIKNDQKSMGLFYIDNFISLVKKNFFDQI